MPTPLHDLLIIGAGPAGSAAAILLARLGLRVALCEQKTFPREKVCGEFMGPHARPLLASLNLLPQYDALAGPDIRHVHIHSGTRTLTAPLPPDEHGRHARALSRAAFDHLLLTTAQQAGATLYHPCHVHSLQGSLVNGFTADTSLGQLRARAILLAHGLAQRTDLAPQTAPPPNQAGFLCFKTHFTSPDLPEDAIAIGGAPGLYAGLVASSQNRTCLAFVIHRKNLAALGPAPDAHLAYLRQKNPAFARMLAPAAQASPWLASGPLLPGPRAIYHDGRFFAGNAAGEVHALVGEGMTLALRSAHLLAAAIETHGLTPAAGALYKQTWLRMFAPRRRAASLFAQLIMRPRLAHPAAALLTACPWLMNACVRWAGK